MNPRLRTAAKHAGLGTVPQPAATPRRRPSPGRALLTLAAALLPVVAAAAQAAEHAPAQAASQAAAQAPAPPFRVERLEKSLDALVPADAGWQLVAAGFRWTEGPVWIPAGYLLFAEIPSNTIRKVVPGRQASIFLEPSGYRGAAPYGGPEPGSNGMTLDPRGRLTVAGHAARNVFRLETLDPNGTRTILAESYRGRRLNSPNDLVYGRGGDLYFTDPPYGLPTQGDSDPQKQLAVNGVYRIRHASAQAPGAPPDPASLELLASDLRRPNGIAFSPDEKFLYVDDSLEKKWMRYPVRGDGTLGPGTVFFDAGRDPRPGAPDGMKVDRAGNLFSAGPGGVWIFSPAGRHLGTLLLPKNVGNVAWGGSDGQTLYVVCSDSVYSVHLSTRGLLP
jgi:gluconolactonase